MYELVFVLVELYTQQLIIDINTYNLINCSIQMHGLNRGDFILVPGQQPMMSFKKKCSPHLRHDGSALLHGGKKRRENGRNFLPCKNTPWVKKKYHPSFSG